MKSLARFVLAACLLAVLGCGKQTHTTHTSDGKEVTLSGDANGASMDVKLANGETAHLQGSATGIAVPADFPKDVPIYPKSILKMASGGGAMHLYGFVLPGTIEEGMAFYEKEFPAQGWKVPPRIAMGPSIMLQGSKAGRTFMIMIGKNGQDTYAQVTLTGAN